MPTFDYDITEEATDYAVQAMEKMVGNEGQQSLVDNIDIDAYASVSIHIAGDRVDITPKYDISIDSSHPEAIGEIIAAGEAHFQEFAERASDILGLVDVAFGELG